MNLIATIGRSVPEWIGSSPDAKVPAHVRLRIFERFGGICQLTGRKIMPGDEWHLDHIKPLADGGEHRESNLHPVLATAHRAKTSAENKARAKVRRIKEKHFGIKRKRSTIPGSRCTKFKRKINGETVLRNG